MYIRPLPGRPFQKFRVPQGVFRGPQGPYQVSGPGSKSSHLPYAIAISCDIGIIALPLAIDDSKVVLKEEEEEEEETFTP